MSPRPNWFDHAACRGMDPNIWHPEQHQNGMAAQAKKICASCPVLEQCRIWSFDLACETDLVGIYAGISKRERNRRLVAEGRRTVNERVVRVARVHGSKRGYDQHRQHGEEPCEACRDAWARWSMFNNTTKRRRRHALKKEQAA